MKTYSQIEQFNKLAAALGSTYAAVRFITIKARTISSRYNYYVLDSEAISWVLSGEKPESAIRYEQELKQHKVALIITIVCALLLLWLIISYIDVIMHNGIGMEHIYAKWNLFTLLF